jgi:hypothetical protein
MRPETGCRMADGGEPRSEGASVFQSDRVSVGAEEGDMRREPEVGGQESEGISVGQSFSISFGQKGCMKEESFWR